MNRHSGDGARRAVTHNAGMTARQPRLEIEYCTQCRWLLRAAWTAQELLTTFGVRLGEVALVPGTGGVFRVRLDDELLWSRKERGGFPELGIAGAGWSTVAGSWASALLAVWLLLRPEHRSPRTPLNVKRFGHRYYGPPLHLQKQVKQVPPHE